MELSTSPIHLEYTTYMRGVDVADQLRGEYSCQVRSHKWWHRIFFFLLDTTMVNGYILHCHSSMGLAQPPMSHLEFLLCTAFKLTESNIPTRKKTSRKAPNQNAIHSLELTCSRHLCVSCKIVRTRMACPQCGYIPMCLGVCYTKAHTMASR